MSRAQGRRRARWGVVVRTALALAIVAWVVSRVGWSALATTLAGLTLSTWATGCALLFGATLVPLLRWHVLMRTMGVPSTVGSALRIGFVGLLFNSTLPGVTGGDVVKALGACREHPTLRARTVLSVLLDRIVGVAALVLVAACVLPLRDDVEPELTWAILGLLAGALGGVGVLLVLARRAPTEESVDAPRSPWRGRVAGLLRELALCAAAMVRAPKTITGCLLLSVLGHLLTISAVVMFGRAIADGAGAGAATDASVLAALPWLGYALVLPIIMLLQAVPLAPGGWGIGEAAFLYGFGLLSVAPALAVALSLTYRLTATLLSVVGGLTAMGVGALRGPAVDASRDLRSSGRLREP